MPHSLPPYFDYLIDSFREGYSNRYVHLGYWDAPPQDREPPRSPAEFELAQHRFNQIVLEQANLQNGQRVLDIGCGFGGTLEHIHKTHSSMHLTGLNIDSRQLSICRTLQPQRENQFHWVEADACSLPFANSVFDRVLCVEAMFHFASRRTFFLEAARVLKAGGVLVASDFVVSESAKNLPIPLFCLEAAIRDGFGPWHDFWGEDADHRALGQAAGMICTELLDVSAQTRPSYRFTVPPDLDPNQDPGLPVLRSALMMRWLHRQGHLRYVIMRLEKKMTL